MMSTAEPIISMTEHKLNPNEQLFAIEKNMSYLDESLTRIVTKQLEIEKVNDGFSKKTMLYSEAHKEQLKFQSSLLENEKHYLDFTRLHLKFKVKMEINL